MSSDNQLNIKERLTKLYKLMDEYKRAVMTEVDDTVKKNAEFRMESVQTLIDELESKEKQTSIFKPFKKKDRKEEIVSLGGTALREAVKEYKTKSREALERRERERQTQSAKLETRIYDVHEMDQQLMSESASELTPIRNMVPGQQDSYYEKMRHFNQTSNLGGNDHWQVPGSTSQHPLPINPQNYRRQALQGQSGHEQSHSNSRHRAHPSLMSAFGPQSLSSGSASHHSHSSNYSQGHGGVAGSQSSNSSQYSLENSEIGSSHSHQASHGHGSAGYDAPYGYSYHPATGQGYHRYAQ